MPPLTPATRRLLVISALAVSGCATRTSSDWVSDVASPARLNGASDAENVRDFSAWRADNADDADDASGRSSGWPRREVITLGKQLVPPVSQSSNQGEEPPDASRSVVLSVTHNYSMTGNGYAYGYGTWPVSGRPPERPTQAPTPQPHPGSPTPPATGGDWPGPPSYGPPMMTQTAPAYPWR